MAETRIKKEIRLVLGMTQKEFCKKYKVSPATVWGWGKNKRPISPKHVKLLKELEFSMDAIEKPGEIV